MNEAISANDSERASEIFKKWLAAPVNRYANGEAQVNRLGYELLSKKKLKEAVEVFKLNAVHFPASTYSYDSLGDAYLVLGNKELALQNYQRAIELDPSNVSAREALEKLRVAP